MTLEGLVRIFWMEYFFSDLFSLGTTYPNDTDPCLANGRSDGSDGIFSWLAINHEKTVSELRGFAPIGLRPVAPTPRREYWSVGVLELWVYGKMVFRLYQSLLQYLITPDVDGTNRLPLKVT